MLRRARAAAVVLAAGFVTFALANAASASTQAEAGRGATILRAVQNENRTCRQLSGADFEAVGELAMQRMVGSPRAHEVLDRAMATMMGARGLDAMHRFLGERATGCARGPAPRGVVEMMGVLGMMNRTENGLGGMMGGHFGSAHGDGGGMMDGRFGGQGGANGNGWGTGAVVIAVLLGVLLLLVLAALIIERGRRTPGARGDAIEILDQRLAAGEIDRDEYQRRRDALGGARP